MAALRAFVRSAIVNQRGNPSVLGRRLPNSEQAVQRADYCGRNRFVRGSASKCELRSRKSPSRCGQVCLILSYRHLQRRVGRVLRERRPGRRKVGLGDVNAVLCRGNSSTVRCDPADARRRVGVRKRDLRSVRSVQCAKHAGDGALAARRPRAGASRPDTRANSCAGSRCRMPVAVAVAITIAVSTPIAITVSPAVAVAIPTAIAIAGVSKCLYRRRGFRPSERA